MASAPTIAAHAPAGDDYVQPGRSDWMDVDWRARQRWETIAGRRVNFVELGEGPAVLLVHGLAGSWQNWLENITHLASSHRVVAMDLPGFGYSEMPAGDVSISGYADCLLELCDRLGIDRAGVVGNSMGGFVGADMAISHPDRVSHLVLVAAAVMWNERRRARPLTTLARVTQAFSAVLVTQWRRSARRRRMRELSLYQVVRHPRRFPAELAYEQIVHVGSPEGFVAGLDALYSYKLRDRLPEISAPTLVVWGANDQLVSIRDAHTLADLIPGASIEIFDDTGHVPMLERPSRFNALIDGFLAR